MPGPQVPPGQR